jgi:hypothetical protein
MPYSTVLYERISELLPHAPHKRMFGGVVFFGRGHMLVGVFGEGMMGRVGPDAADEAWAQAGVRPLASQPKRMTICSVSNSGRCMCCMNPTMARF